MFFKRDTLIVMGQLLLIVLLALVFSTTELSPLNNYVIESVEGFQRRGGRLEYTEVSQPNTPKDDVYANTLINPDKSECKKVSGFSKNGIFCTPNSQPENIDIYSQAKGDINCNGLGYFNSKGPLCMDDKMKNMLSTRGANAVGGNGQIGSA
jgi:hypothetical protein